jgi:hypothetical protein
MKKCLLLAGLALILASFGWAQQADQTDSTAHLGTVRGCLGGSEGNYTLTQDKSGTMFRLVGNDDLLKGHLGYEVLVTGQLSAGEAAASTDEQGAGNTPANNSAASSTSDNTIQVSNITMVSKTCTTGNRSSQY